VCYPYDFIFLTQSRQWQLYFSIVLLLSVDTKKKKCRIHITIRKSCYCYESKCIYIYTYLKTEILFIISRLMMMIHWDFKWWNCIKVRHEVQLNKNKDDEVIQNDKSVEILVKIENNCIKVWEILLKDSDRRCYFTFVRYILF